MKLHEDLKSMANNLAQSERDAILEEIKKQKDFDKLWFYQKYLKDN